jgi:hypothetical protein
MDTDEIARIWSESIVESYIDNSPDVIKFGQKMVSAGWDSAMQRVAEEACMFWDVLDVGTWALKQIGHIPQPQKPTNGQ